MRKLLKLGLSISMVLSISVLPALGLGADSEIYDHYIYSNEGVPLKSPAAYLPDKIVQNDVFGLAEIPQIADIFVSNEASGKQVYLVDSKNNCIIVLDKDLQLVKVISAVYEDGVPPETEDPDANPGDDTPSDGEDGDNTSSGGETSTPEGTNEPSEPDDNQSAENSGESSAPESSTPSEEGETPVPASGYAAPADGADEAEPTADGDETGDGQEPAENGEPTEGEEPTEGDASGDGEGGEGQTEVDGFITSFNKPEGIYVTNDGQIFLADTDNKRIVVMDIDGNLIREYPDPGIVLLGESVSFLPSKVTVDNGGRMYVVAKNVNRGLVQLDSEGDFIGFLGAPRVVPNLIEYFWKMISTEEQLAQMETYVPTEYNNVTIDESGFLYSTIGTLDADEFTNAILTKDKSGTITPIRKLENKGNDILKRKGEYAPVGDIFQYRDLPSIIVDVALSDDGRYAMLDQRRGRIFTYDMDGNLLYIFGGSGTQFGQLSEASSLAYLDDKILVADKSLGRITSYKITEYAACINEAVRLNKEGDYEGSAAKWAEALQMNSNLYVAYIGLGKNEWRKENYDQAMEYLEIANEKDYYSKAFQAARKDFLSSIFNIIGVVVILLIVGIFILRYLKKRKKKRGEAK